MSTITTTGRPTAEQLLRHCGLYARDLYDLNGDTGPHKIAGVTTTVAWDPHHNHAVYELDGVRFTVPSAALDAVDLIPTEEHTP
jgi:hypothetical protein